MNAKNIAAALDILLSIVGALQEAAAQFGAVIAKARSEGRDVTDAELDTLRDTRNAALKRLTDKAGS